MDGIEDSIMDRATTAQTPVVVVLAALNEDFDNTEGTRLAGKLRREALSTSGVVQDTDYDHTVNTLGVRLVSTVEFDEAEEMKGVIRNALRDEPYSVDTFAIQADIETSTL